MSANLGVSVVEGVTKGTTPFIDGSKFNVGILFERERGVAFVPTEVSTLSEDRLKFGGNLMNTNYEGYGFGALIVRHIFNNASPNTGVNIFGVRVVGLGCQAAKVNLDAVVNTQNVTVMRIYAGQQGRKDVGTWANGTVWVKLIPKNHVQGAVNAYTMQVYFTNQNGVQALVETFVENNWQKLIAKVNMLSNYIMCEPKILTNEITDIRFVQLTGGVYEKPEETDYNYTPDELLPSGLACLDTCDIQMIAAADLTTLESIVQVSEYAKNHKNKPIYVFTLPMESTTQIVETFADVLQTNTPSCSAGYNFWVNTNDEQGNTVWTPSTGVVIGAGFLRIPALNNNQIHYPPAGINSVFSDVLDITPKSISEPIMEKWVTRYSINTAKYKKGVGYYLQSSRTLSTNLLYQSIHIRRVTNYFVQQLKDNLEWIIQEPITPELNRAVYVSLYNYFLTEYSTRGAIEQSIPFEQACVITVEQNKINRKHLEIGISIILTECAEAVKISLNRNDNSLSSQVS